MTLEASLARQLTPWLKRTDALVRRKVGDAAAHAHRAVTKKLRSERDGRPTLKLATAHPSYLAAVARLEELRVALAGPSVDSTKGLLRDAREDFFVAAFDLLRPELDPKYFRVDARPSREQIAVARGAIVHGYSLADELGGVFDQQLRSLRKAVALAGTGTIALEHGRDLIDLWEETAAKAISARCVQVLGDDQWALYWAAQATML